ncbi:uncharacterized protein SCODWIG_00377 [Saccharomycodes ludwigii]|uniref:Uncharacterized protein n=1 Tax=Saccharomycodes ludwigii TaxID=36035 RepID=A0A376B1Q4_9ASCO|nr:uncharacterized protein SCODWIG_00377 [Saccharomycodes ludwigii]
MVTIQITNNNNSNNKGNDEIGIRKASKRNNEEMNTTTTHTNNSTHKENEDFTMHAFSTIANIKDGISNITTVNTEAYSINNKNSRNDNRSDSNISSSSSSSTPVHFNKKKLDPSIKFDISFSPTTVSSSNNDTILSEGNTIVNTSLLKFAKVTPKELSQKLIDHYKIQLPDCSLMFPWLHSPSFWSSQSLLCNTTSPNTIPQKIPKEFVDNNIMIVRSSPVFDRNFIENSGIFKNSVDPREIFFAYDPIVHDITQITTCEFRKLYPNVGVKEELLLNKLIQLCQEYSILPILSIDDKAQYLYGCRRQSLLLSRNIDLAAIGTENTHSPTVYNEPKMLRRFDLQMGKMLQLTSKCVVYCLNKDDHINSSCNCLLIAQLIDMCCKLTNDRLCETSASAPTIPMEVMILDYDGDDELFNSRVTISKNTLMGTPLMNVASLEKAPQQLVSEFDATSFNNWEKDLFYREKLEVSKMSHASKISEHVWAGNSIDFELYKMKKFNKEDTKQGYYFDAEYSTVVNVGDLDPSKYEENDFKLFYIPAEEIASDWRLFIHCHENCSLPIKELESESNLHKIKHLSFPSSGLIGLGNLNLSSIKSILKICYLIFSSGEKCLIYSSDGYTETSFLIVAYLIYLHDISLDDALLKLHLVLDRPIFLFPSDLQVLLYLQNLLREKSPQKAPQTYFDLDISQEVFSKMFFYNTSTTDFIKLKGPFPSRILPHLYLGSLQHAESPELLKKLNISNIVSVGERLEWVKDYPFSAAHSRKYCGGGGKKNVRETPQTVVIEQDGFRIFYIDNLADNGKDPLLNPLSSILGFIEEVYEAGGKVLVHCMVGVSRSATVCIAETMKRLNVGLLQAYLYVRVRRLNIIIQPNLMFMYELLKWYEMVHGERNIDWHILCRAIAELNENYISNT